MLKDDKDFLNYLIEESKFFETMVRSFSVGGQRFMLHIQPLHDQQMPGSDPFDADLFGEIDELRQFLKIALHEHDVKLQEWREPSQTLFLPGEI